MNEYQDHEAAVRAALGHHGDYVRDPKTGIPVSPIRQTWLILVYCREESHAAKRWEIGDFWLRVPPSADAVPFWQWQPRRIRHRKRAGQPRQQTGTHAFPPGQHLIGTRLLPSHSDSSPHDLARAEGLRVESRYPLKCSMCDLSLPWRQNLERYEDPLQIELDKRAIAGVSQVALAELVAKLTSR